MGTSKIRGIKIHDVEDHPHACGDKGYKSYLPMIKLGSSPRVWGQGFMKERMRRYFRIIPTRVGTSDALAIGQLLPRDHPHACGDKEPIGI